MREGVAQDLDSLFGKVIDRAADVIEGQLNKPPADAGAQPAPAGPVLKADPTARLSSGHRPTVYEVQVHLKALGYLRGAADGLIGGQSRQAIIAYQNADGYASDGSITAGLLNRLRQASGVARAETLMPEGLAQPAAPEPAPETDGARVLNRDRGAVSEVQTLLNLHGYEAGTVDGLYGGGTRSAVRAFQRDTGREPTGDVTADLLAALREHGREAPAASPAAAAPAAAATAAAALPAVSASPLARDGMPARFGLDTVYALGFPLRRERQQAIAGSPSEIGREFFEFRRAMCLWARADCTDREFRAGTVRLAIPDNDFDRVAWYRSDFLPAAEQLTAELLASSSDYVAAKRLNFGRYEFDGGYFPLIATRQAAASERRQEVDEAIRDFLSIDAVELSVDPGIATRLAEDELFTYRVPVAEARRFSETYVEQKSQLPFLEMRFRNDWEVVAGDRGRIDKVMVQPQSLRIVVLDIDRVRADPRFRQRRDLNYVDVAASLPEAVTVLREVDMAEVRAGLGRQPAPMGTEGGAGRDGPAGSPLAMNPIGSDVPLAAGGTAARAADPAAAADPSTANTLRLAQQLQALPSPMLPWPGEPTDAALPPGAALRYLLLDLARNMPELLQSPGPALDYAGRFFAREDLCRLLKADQCYKVEPGRRTTVDRFIADPGRNPMDDYSGWPTDDPFKARDQFDYFRAQLAPMILQLETALPFRVRYADGEVMGRVSVGDYDFDRGYYPTNLDQIDSGNRRHLAAMIGMQPAPYRPVGSEIAAGVDDARAFNAAAAGGIQADFIYRVNGIDYAKRQVDIELVDLRAYFGPDRRQALPERYLAWVVPPALEPAAAAAGGAESLVAGPDMPLLVGMSMFGDILDEQAWRNAVANRREVEKHDLPEVPDLQPEGAFFGAAPADAAQLSAYREWLVARAADLPERVVFHRTGTPEQLCRGPFLPARGFAEIADPASGVERSFPWLSGTGVAALGSGTFEVERPFFLRRFGGVLVFPRPLADYARDLSALCERVRNPSGRLQVRLVGAFPGARIFDSEGQPVDPATFDPEADRSPGWQIFYPVVPLAYEVWDPVAREKVGEIALDQAPGLPRELTLDPAQVVAARAQAKQRAEADAQSAAQAALDQVLARLRPPSVEAYGPDVVGVRLGMPLEEAEAIVRAHLEALTGVYENRGGDPAKDGPYANARLFLRQEPGMRQDMIKLFHEPIGGRDVVVGLVREVELPEGVELSDLMPQLEEKYGPFAERKRGAATYRVASSGRPLESYPLCDPFASRSGPESSVLVAKEPGSEGRASRSELFHSAALSGDLADLEDLAELAACGPVVTVVAQYRAPARGTSLTISLFDEGNYVGHFYPALQQARETAKPKPKVKL